MIRLTRDIVLPVALSATPLTACLITASLFTACGPPSPEEATAPPDLTGILAAHGGTEALLELDSLALSWQLVTTASHQSRHPEPPWDRSFGRRDIAIDLASEKLSDYADTMDMGAYPFHRQIVIDGDRGVEANYYDGYRRALGGDEFSSRSSEVVRFTAPLVMRLLAGQTSASGAAAESPGQPLAVTLPTGEVARLGFDDRARLAWLEVALPDGIRQRVSYLDYDESGPVPINRGFEVRSNGELYLEADVIEVQFVESIDSLLSLRHSVPLVTFEPTPGAFDWKFDEIAPGVHFVGDTVWHSVFVERDDHLVALGAVRGAERRLEAVRERFPDKPVRATVISHHHDDHLEGVKAHAEVGSEFLVSPGHVEIVRRAAGDSAVVRAVETELRLEAPAWPAIRVLPTGPISHSAEYLATLIEDSALLYTADLYVQHPGRPLRAVNPAIRDLVGFIQRSGALVDHLVDPHTPKINRIDELMESMQKEPAFGGRFAISTFDSDP